MTFFFHFLINWAQFLALPQENETSLLQDFINNWRRGCFDYDVWELWQQTLHVQKSSKQLCTATLACSWDCNVHVQSVLHGFLTTLASDLPIRPALRDRGSLSDSSCCNPIFKQGWILNTSLIRMGLWLGIEHWQNQQNQGNPQVQPQVQPQVWPQVPPKVNDNTYLTLKAKNRLKLSGDWFHWAIENAAWRTWIWGKRNPGEKTSHLTT